jgi:adenylylsulfate kinase-like enzyme
LLAVSYIPGVATHVRGGEDLDHGRSCLLITGAPGAGKSTVSRLVANSLSRAALMDGDVVNRFVVSGRVWALGEPADEAARQVRLCNQNLCQLAVNFVDAGFTPVIDWIVPDRQQLDQFRNALGARRLVVVVLAPSIEVCQYRNAIRDPEDQFFFDGYEALTSKMRSELGSAVWWLDTSDLGPEETAWRIATGASAQAHAGP